MTGNLPFWRLFGRIVDAVSSGNKEEKVKIKLKDLVQFFTEVVIDSDTAAMLQNYSDGFNTPIEEGVNGDAMLLGHGLRHIIESMEDSHLYYNQRWAIAAQGREDLALIKVFEKELVEEGLLDKKVFMYAWKIDHVDTTEYDATPSLKDYLSSRIN